MMAAYRQLLPAQGLLLCVLALHFCTQGSLAIAGHKVVNMSTATNHTSMAATKASVATKQTSVAITRALMATSKQASVATTSASMAISNQALMATNQALVATNQALVATSQASMATSNQALVATSQASMATTKTSMATNQALVATNQASVATTSAPIAASNHSSMTITTSVDSSQASMAANTSMNHTEQTPLSCQSFQCSRERCYQDEAHSNMTATCHNETFCELYRFSSTNYTARCSSTCSAELCRTNGSVTLQQCTMECCNTSLCLQLNASSYGDLPSTTVTPTTTITTPRLPPRNGKICAAFSCHGDGCFKGKKSTATCFVGHDFCEVKKTGSNYVAGCSKACKSAKPVCAHGVKAACFQECCPATPKGSCLKLDGKVHMNGAGLVAVSPLLQLLACGTALLLSLRASTPLHGSKVPWSS
ncbi:uncharacterized protein LOC107324007 [Coturnix japonica]|uniref:uncharacterized protein LOC107324007 n=1 Tax=Coturnix japonica TaxID=93934 RepID=UPI000777A1E6|nr:uncharacterized protein LOC107324007 [Coturnix japonica]XP_015739140.1 uncharacterized protein LOC107324007 [Coturnix japonica]XP_032304856.1 uncharacterized protein LOC107324007 [Coturnix japonica]